MYDRCVKLILSKDSDIQPEPKVKIQVRHACNMVKIILNLLLTCELHGPPELEESEPQSTMICENVVGAKPVQCMLPPQGATLMWGQLVSHTHAVGWSLPS